MGSLFITPALAFLSGSSTLNAFLDAVSSSTEYDSYLGETAPNLASVVHQFTILVGPNYARRYAFQQDLTRLREAGEKGVIISLANHLRQMERNAPLVSGAALALLQDEANLDEEGAVHFIRFPRVTPALPPNLLGPQHHDVEDMRNPGQELKTPIPHNLVLEDYREILQVKSPQEAVAVFTDFLEIPARRILALKYWYFSLDGDVDMRRTTAKALLKTVIEEGWGDFQEFAIRIVSNLLAEEYNIWMIFYLRELWHYLSEVDSQHLTPLQEKTVLALVGQFGSVLYRHTDDLKGQPSQLGYEEVVSGLLRFFDPSRNFPRKIREEAFYLWAFIVEDFYRNGKEGVHERLKRAAAEEKDIDLLNAILDRHIWKGQPLPMKRVRELIAITLRRADLTEEQKSFFEMLVKRDDQDSVVEVAAGFRKRFESLGQLLLRWLKF